MIKVGIIGGTGYTGVELLRLLVQHPEVTIVTITSRSEAGKPVTELFPNLSGLESLLFSEPDVAALSSCDVVFSATPNGIAMTMAEPLLAAGVKLIDLAADFRFSDVALWSKWYGMEHACENLLSQAVYGLPEANRETIATANLIGNPGCYPTAVQLGLLPLLEAGVITTTGIIADCKSGISGAGRGASVATLQAESAESFKAYALAGHRHQPEIAHNLSKWLETDVGLLFMPHLVPMIRGIFATLYTTLTDTSVDVQALFSARYQDEPFVDVLAAGTMPETRWVKGSNRCKIAIQQREDTVVVFSVIDNLVKGASGQAVQNMNIACGLPETMGIDQVALLP